MAENPPRLGEVVDDYCSHCRLVTNHGVMVIVGGKVKRVRCAPCLHEHAFHHAKVPKRKDQVKDLFDQVLARIPGASAASAPEKPAAGPRPRPRTPHLGMRTRPLGKGRPRGGSGGGSGEGGGGR
jgi:hypothetical protein